MTFEHFSAVNRRRSESPDGFDHALGDWSLSDWFTAVAGELGEAANVCKKLNRIRDGIAGNRQCRICPRCGTSWRHDHVRVEVCSCGCDLTAVAPVADPAVEIELRAQLRREVADTFIYLDLLAQAAGFTLGEAVRDTFNAKSRQLGCDIEL